MVISDQPRQVSHHMVFGEAHRTRTRALPGQGVVWVLYQGSDRWKVHLVKGCYKGWVETSGIRDRESCHKVLLMKIGDLQVGERVYESEFLLENLGLNACRSYKVKQD